MHTKFNLHIPSKKFNLHIRSLFMYTLFLVSSHHPMLKSLIVSLIPSSISYHPMLESLTLFKLIVS